MEEARKRLWWAVVGLERAGALGGRLGSCLRRNDGKEAGSGLGAGHIEIPAAERGYDGSSLAGVTELFCAGVTVVGRGCDGGGARGCGEVGQERMV